MKSSPKGHESIDQYIADCPKDVQRSLKKLRSTIRKAAPQAEASISYRIPAFKFHGPLIYFAAHTHHIGIYPATEGVKKAFKKDLAVYEMSKGTIRFPLDEPIPLALIEKIVKFRIKENLARMKSKKKS